MAWKPIMRSTTTGIIAVLLAAGCGGDGESGADGATRTVNIHVSGNLAKWGAQAVRAEQLAVTDANGRAGAFKIRVIVHDEGSLEELSEPERVRRNAEATARDRDAIAYIGDLNSGSTAISAPILNRAGVLQVSPVSTYVGLTRPEGADSGEPEKYRPAGRRTFARVIPADHVQARAGVVYARDLGVERLGVVADETLFGRGLAQLVLSAARDLGLPAIGGGGGGSLAAQARRAVAAGADAVYFAACGPEGDLIGFAEDHPDAKVLTGDCYTNLNESVPPGPLKRLSDRFFVTAPGGGLEKTPAGREWAERWRERVGTPADDKLMFCYEAMSAVLAAIERAGPEGDDRAAVVREFFATRDRDSILGRYSIDRHGDTTLRAYGGFAVRDGKLRFDRVLDTGG